MEWRGSWSVYKCTVHALRNLDEGALPSICRSFGGPWLAKPPTCASTVETHRGEYSNERHLQIVYQQ